MNGMRLNANEYDPVVACAGDGSAVGVDSQLST
jgi:hypothetical protein